MTPSGCAAVRSRFSAQMRAGSRNDSLAFRPSVISARAEVLPNRKPSARPTGRMTLNHGEVAGLPMLRNRRASALLACRVVMTT